MSFNCLFQIPTPCVCDLRWLPRPHLPDPDLWYLQPCHAANDAFTEELCTASDWFHGRVLHNVTGTFHSGHAASLHLQSSWDDQMGERNLWSYETTGDYECRSTGQDLGSWGSETLPGQVKNDVHYKNVTISKSKPSTKFWQFHAMLSLQAALYSYGTCSIFVMFNLIAIKQH